jgi:hypothetical protein
VKCKEVTSNQKTTRQLPGRKSGLTQKHRISYRSTRLTTKIKLTGGVVT